MKVKALTFSITGTITDWYAYILKELTLWGSAKNIEHVNWDVFLRTWKQKTNSITLNARRIDLPNGTIDGVYRIVLDSIMDKFELTRLTPADQDYLCSLWYGTKPWPDVRQSLQCLRRHFFVTTLTNLSIPMVTTISKNSGIDWDLTLSCQMFEHYKLFSETYLKAAEWLNLPPEEIMMVGAHSFDLAGAQAAGFKTGYISRPLELGPDGGSVDTDNIKGDPSLIFDIYASDLLDFSRQMGCID